MWTWMQKNTNWLFTGILLNLHSTESLRNCAVWEKTGGRKQHLTSVWTELDILLQRKKKKKTQIDPLSSQPIFIFTKLQNKQSCSLNRLRGFCLIAGMSYQDAPRAEIHFTPIITNANTTSGCRDAAELFCHNKSANRSRFIHLLQHKQMSEAGYTMYNALISFFHFGANNSHKFLNILILWGNALERLCQWAMCEGFSDVLLRPRLNRVPFSGPKAPQSAQHNPSQTHTAESHCLFIFFSGQQHCETPLMHKQLFKRSF